MLRACRTPGCPSVAVAGRSHCQRCERDYNASPARRAAKRQYGKFWQTVRAVVLLRDHYRCQECGAPASDVDHRQPRSEGGTDDPSNLQSLCRSCHSRKTVRDGRWG